MKLQELSKEQIYELQCDLFFGDETPRLFKHLPSINVAEDIPFEVLQKYYKDWDFTADDFPYLSPELGGTYMETTF